MSRRNKSQSGMALVVGLILLALMTVMALTSFNIGRTSMDVVGNLQRHNEVVSAANSAIQEALSTTRLFQSPNTIFLTPCSGSNTRCYDVNGDGTNDITVTLTPAPTCVQAQTIANASLNLSVPDDAGCATGAAQTFGIAGSATGSSLCASSVWEVTAVASDAVTETQVVVTEGASVRVSTDDVGLTCLLPGT